MRQTRRRSPCLLGLAGLLALACMMSLCILAIADDADILLELAAATRANLTGWSLNNKANLCVDWQGVACQGGRVTDLELKPSTIGIPNLRGTIPASFAQLDALQQLAISDNLLSGEFPLDVFNFPNIVSLDLSSSGLTIKFPENFSVAPTLQRLLIADLHVNSTLPNLNWPNVSFLDVVYSEMRCPLPQSLVDYVMSGGTIRSCLMHGNYLEIDKDSMLCGQIPLYKMSCNVSPEAYVSPYFDSDTRPTNLQFRAEIDGKSLEFNDSEVRIFATYTKNGVRTEYRREYISFKMQPVTEEYDPQFYIKTFNNTVWETFVWESPTRLKVNCTRMENLTMEWTFDFDRKDAEGQPQIKFSIAIYNHGYTFRTASHNQNIGLNFVVNYKIEHSDPDGPVPTCTPLNFVSASCGGTAASVVSTADFSTGEVTQVVQSKTIIMKFTYGIQGYVDGQALSSSTVSSKVGAIMNPFPSVNWFINLKKQGIQPQFSYKPKEDQSFVIPIRFEFIPFKTKVLYDPDISITLLFDPGQELQAGLTGGVIAAIVIAVIVALAGVTVCAKFLFPYWSRSRADQEAMNRVEFDDVEEDNGGARATQSSWSAARPNQHV